MTAHTDYSHCVQGMVRAGSVPCWVTFEGSPARIAPRSPLHDSWATPTGLSPFEAQLQRSAGAGTMRRLELEPPVEEAAEEQPQEDADGVHPQQRGEPAGAPQTSHGKRRLPPSDQAGEGCFLLRHLQGSRRICAVVEMRE